jgi:hypothetical protein
MENKPFNQNMPPQNYNPNMVNPNMPPQNYNPNMINPNMPPQNYNPNMPPQNYNPNMGYPNMPPQNYNPNMINPNMLHLMNDNRPFIPHKEKIMSLTGVFIKQEMNLLEVMTGCEVENKYKIYSKKEGKTKKKGKGLWKAKEKSGCCSRNCLSNTCRELDIKVKNESNLEDDPTSLRIHKPCTCTFYCCNRPVILVDYTEEGQSQYIGKIVDVFDCCNFNFNVYDKNNSKIFRIHTECCQCGIWCGGCGCGPCEKVNFKVFDANNIEITMIQKKNKDCFKSIISDADNFGIEFTPQMDWEQRSLLLSAALFIDYMMFEEKGNQNSGNGGIGLGDL